jgi:type II secretion system protein N
VKKGLIFILLTAAVIVWGIWIAVPENVLISVIEDSAPEGMFTLKVTGLKKGLFYRVDIEKLAVQHSGGEMCSFRNISWRMNPLSLMTLKVRSSVRGSITGGGINGEIRLGRKTRRVSLDLENVSVQDVPLFERIGLYGKGILSGRYSIIDDTGQIEFSTENASLEPVSVSGNIVPLNFFHRIRGALKIRGDTVEIVSVNLEGDHVFARLKGTVRNAFADMVIEIMPDAVFHENPVFLYELRKFKVSPGYYVIPVKQQLRI